MTDKDLVVTNRDQADKVNSLITYMGYEIVRLTAPKNKAKVRYLLNRRTFAHMELDKFELLKEREA